MAQDSFCFPFPDVLKENDLYSKLKYKSYCFVDFKIFLLSLLEFSAKNSATRAELASNRGFQYWVRSKNREK